jgi:hypothetical protein
MEAGLEGIAIDLIEGNLAGLAAFGIGRDCGGLHAREKGIKTLAQGAAFGIDGGGSHISNSSIRGVISRG